jgi:hypothetical protein
MRFLWRSQLTWTLRDLVIYTEVPEEPACIHHHMYPEDGDKSFLCNIGTYLPDYHTCLHGVNSCSFFFTLCECWV